MNFSHIISDDPTMRNAAFEGEKTESNAGTTGSCSIVADRKRTVPLWSRKRTESNKGATGAFAPYGQS